MLPGLLSRQVRAAATCVVFCLIAASSARAHTPIPEGPFVAVGPLVGTAAFGKHRSPHGGAELSCGYLWRDTRSVGLWFDVQRSGAELDQLRTGGGAQATIAGFGVDVGGIMVRAGDVWNAGFRGRFYAGFGVVGLAAGLGQVEHLGKFSEFTLLVKLPSMRDL